MITPLNVKVLGSGCSKCRSTIGLIERTAREAGIEFEIVKIESPDAIRAYGVQATPAVVIANRVVHSGGIPSHEEVRAGSSLLQSGS
jgi:arsenite-transporting ATPase